MDALSEPIRSLIESGPLAHLFTFNARTAVRSHSRLLQRLAYTYVWPGVTFPPMPNPPPGFVTRIGVERVAGLGPSSDGS